MNGDIETYLKDTYFDKMTAAKPSIETDKENALIFSYKGEMAGRERDQFFNEAYGDILYSLFMEWLKTSTLDTEEREHLYRTALALGSLKETMLRYEMNGRNVSHMGVLNEDENEEE